MMLNDQSVTKNWYQKLRHPDREIIYGVTDLSHENFLVQLNNWLIDRSRVSAKDKSLFFHALNSLVSSGMGVGKSILMLAKRSKNIHLSRVLYTIYYDVNSGVGIAKAFGKHPNIFCDSEAKMMKAAEITGRVDMTLANIATAHQKNLHLRNAIRQSMLYPLIVFIGVIFSVLIILMFVIPQFSALFAEFNHDLPLITRALVFIANGVKGFWWLVLLFLLAIIMGFTQWQNSRSGRWTWDGWLLKAPLIASLVNNIQTLRIAANMSYLLEAGVPIARAIKVVSEIVRNVVIAHSLREVEQQIKNGTKLHLAIASQPCLDPILSELAEVGEESGQLPGIMKKISNQYEIDVDYQFNNLSTIIEPAILLVVGLMVTGLALAIMLPIFELQELFISHHA